MPEKPIRVTVFRFGDRPSLYMQYRDPMTGRKVSKATGTKSRRDAERIAAKWEAELREGRYAAPSKTTWPEFRDRYEKEVLTGLAEKTRMKVSTVLDAVENIINPARLRDVTAERLSYFTSKLREGGRAETTIEGYLAHLSAALKWAADIGLIVEAPKITKPKRTKGGKLMKGRPITGEEFDRMLEAIPRVTGQEAAASWRQYLLGLWHSGLRLEESLNLYWDRDDRLTIDLSGARPMLLIPAEFEKGHKDRRLPIAPEFSEFLLATPEAERRGRVFRPQPRRCHGEFLTVGRVSRVISAIGKAAGVKVNTEARSGKVKYASAHDLRRSFGERWARRPGITPQVLMELMRHESIETTMRFYVGKNAEATMNVLWAAIEQRSEVSPANVVANSADFVAPAPASEASPNF